MSTTITARPAATPAHASFVATQERLLHHYGVDATSRYLDLEQPPLRAHVLEAGRGDPVVILHGGDGQGVDWAPLMSLLQNDLHLYAVDRPGFGLTDSFDYRGVDLRSHAASFVTSLLDALGLETATIVGGSMGGFFSLATALEHPDRVRALVLVGMPVGLARDCPLPLRVICGVPGLAGFVTGRLGQPTAEFRKQQYEKMFRVDTAAVPELYFEMQAAGMSIPGALATWGVLLPRVAGLRGMRRAVTLASELPGLDVPTLLIWAERDMVPPSVGKAASEVMPSARFTCLPGIGHFPFLEAPERCAELILDFLTNEGSAR